MTDSALVTLCRQDRIIDSALFLSALSSIGSAHWKELRRLGVVTRRAEGCS